MVTIYSTEFCGFCHAAKRYLIAKDIAFEEIDLTGDRARRAEIAKRAGISTVPMIFIGDTCIGGYMELVALDRKGQLKPMVEAAEIAMRDELGLKPVG